MDNQEQQYALLAMANEEEVRYEYAVHVEDTGDLVTLFLTQDEILQANEDPEFVRERVNALVAHGAELDAEAEAGAKADTDEELDDDTRSLTPPIDTTEEHIGEPAVTGTADVMQVATERTEGCVWPDKAVLLFIEAYRRKQEDFSSGGKRHMKVWNDIAEELRTANSTYEVTAQQCATKMAGLKRTYKNISDANKKSGNSPSTWAFFSAMDSLFGVKAWRDPPTVASSDGPLNPVVTHNTSDSNSTQNSSLEELRVTKKRRIDKVLVDFVENVKKEREERLKKQEAERVARDEKKEARFHKRLADRQKMHNEKLTIQVSVAKSIDRLAKAFEK